MARRLGSLRRLLPLASAGVVAGMIVRPPGVLCLDSPTRELSYETLSARIARLEVLARVSPVAMAADHEAKIIDGRKIAADIRKEVKAQSAELSEQHGIVPGLAVVLVGQRTDSATYVRMKKRAATECGFYSIDKNFDERVTQDELIETPSTSTC